MPTTPGSLDRRRLAVPTLRPLRRVLASLGLLGLACAVLAGSADSARAGAYGPSTRHYDVEHYRIGLRLQPGGEYRAQTVIWLSPKRPLREIELDATGFTVDRVTLLPAPPGPGSIPGALPNLPGSVLRFEHKSAPAAPLKKGAKPAPAAPPSLLVVHLPAEAAAGSHVTIAIRHHGKAGTEQLGFFRADTPGKPDRLPLYVTMFEPEGARRLFPCHDHPSDKATTEVILEVDPRYHAYANGTLVTDREVTVDGKTGGLPGRYRQVHWLQRQAHSTYLVAIAIGQFETLRDRAGKTPIAIHVTPGNGARTRFALDVTKFSLGFFEQYLSTPYPWSRYDQAALPTFVWGGMENTTLTVQSEPRLVLDTPGSQVSRPNVVGLVSHELAHQWFGNLVTMVGWEDIWLNEAFASFMESQASAAYFKNEGTLVASVYDLWDSYFRTEQGPKSHPIVQTELPSVDDAFDSISYTKGEHVLRMLRAHLGEEVFKKGLSRYLHEHAYANTTNLGFFTEMERASGKDLARFRRSWLLARGYPIITARSHWDAKKGELALEVSQRSNHAKDKTEFVAPMEIVVHRWAAPAYDKTIKLVLDGKSARATVALPAPPEWVNWNREAIVLGEILTPGRKQSELEAQARHDPDPLARLRALLDLVEPLVRRQRPAAPPTPVLEVLAHALCEDPSPYVRAALLSKLVLTSLDKLPAPLGHAVVLNAAAGPAAEGAARSCSAPLPMADTVGLARLRAAGLEAAGLAGTAEARELLGRQLAQADVSTDVLGPAGRGMARFADAAALSALNAAHGKHAARGYAFEYALAGAWSRMPTPLVASELRRRVDAAIVGGNEALVRQLIGGMGDNARLMRTPEAVALVVHWVNGQSPLGEQLRSRVLGLLDEVKAPPARGALREIASKSSSPRLRALAERTLKKNFR